MISLFLSTSDSIYAVVMNKKMVGRWEYMLTILELLIRSLVYTHSLKVACIESKATITQVETPTEHLLAALFFFFPDSDHHLCLHDTIRLSWQMRFSPAAGW